MNIPSPKETRDLERNLLRSKFRSNFKLSPEDQTYIARVGMEKIISHARDFVHIRIAPQNPKNDGKQTPFRGHPVFKAQHATATCCRSCVRKWYGFPKGVSLSEEESQYLVDQIIHWIQSTRMIELVSVR